MAEITVKLRPWMVPNFATPDISGAEGASIKVEDLPPEALDDMARQWLAGLYKKAGKHNPWAQATP